jgi:hypothetical protein
MQKGAYGGGMNSWIFGLQLAILGGDRELLEWRKIQWFEGNFNDK